MTNLMTRSFTLIFLNDHYLFYSYGERGLYLKTKAIYGVSLLRKYKIQMLLSSITSFIITFTSVLHSEDSSIAPFNSQPVDTNAVG